MTSSKWPHRQPVDVRNWRTYWHRRAVGACGEVKTSWFYVGRAVAWGKACDGSHSCLSRGSDLHILLVMACTAYRF